MRLDLRSIERIKYMILVRFLKKKEIQNELGWSDHRLRPHYKEAVRQIKESVRGKICENRPSEMPHRKIHNLIPERLSTQTSKLGLSARYHKGCAGGACDTDNLPSGDPTSATL